MMPRCPGFELLRVVLPVSFRAADLSVVGEELNTNVDLTYIQIGRYEQQKSKPSSDIVRRLADALGTTADFLMNGDSQTVAVGKIIDRDLLGLFAAVEQLDASDQTIVKTLIDALVTKRRVQALA